MTTNNLIVLIMLSLLCIAFAIYVWKDVSGYRQRIDSREAKKAEDTLKDPFVLDKDQQPAELQVGQRDEVRRPNRLAPDQLPR